MQNTGLTNTEVTERISKGLINKSTVTKTKKIKEIVLENVFSVFNIVITSVTLLPVMNACYMILLVQHL